MVEKRKLFLYFLFFSKIAPRWGQIGQSYLALGRAKLRKSSKVEFIGANSDFGGVEMVPVPPVLAQIVQNEPWWAKLALEKLGPIWFWGQFGSFHFTVHRDLRISPIIERNIFFVSKVHLYSFGFSTQIRTSRKRYFSLHKLMKSLFFVIAFIALMIMSKLDSLRLVLTEQWTGIFATMGVFFSYKKLNTTGRKGTRNNSNCVNISSYLILRIWS